MHYQSWRAPYFKGQQVEIPVTQNKRSSQFPWHNPVPSLQLTFQCVCVSISRGICTLWMSLCRSLLCRLKEFMLHCTGSGKVTTCYGTYLVVISYLEMYLYDSDIFHPDGLPDRPLRPWESNYRFTVRLLSSMPVFVLKLPICREKTTHAGSGKATTVWWQLKCKVRRLGFTLLKESLYCAIC